MNFLASKRDLSYNLLLQHYYDGSITRVTSRVVEIALLCHLMTSVLIISCGSLLFSAGSLPAGSLCDFNGLSFSGYIQLKCVPAAKIFTLGPNHPRSSLLTCRECCHNRAGAAVHRIQSVTPRCPLCPQICVQYQYTLPHTFSLVL